MKNSIVMIVIPGRCVPKGRPRVKTLINQTALGGVTRKSWSYTPKQTRDYEQQAKLIAQNAIQNSKFKMVPYPQPVGLHIEFILRREPAYRPDVVNLASTIADILNHVAYDDDCQVVEMTLKKKKGKYPMTHVKIERL